MAALVTLLPALARAGAASNATGTPVQLGYWKRALFVLKVTASATDAGDTLDTFIDFSIDGGTSWLNGGHFAQQAGNGAAKTEYMVFDPSAPGTATIAATSDASAGVVRPAIFGLLVRARYTIVEVSTVNASHTFSITGLVQ